VPLGAGPNLCKVQALLDPKVLGITGGSFTGDDEIVLVASPFFETASYVSPFVQFVLRSRHRTAGMIFVISKAGLSLAQSQQAETEECLASLAIKVSPASLLYSAHVLDLTSYHFQSLDGQRAMELWTEVSASTLETCEAFKHRLAAVPEVFLRPAYQML